MRTRLNKTIQEERPPSLSRSRSPSLPLFQTYTTHVIICFMLSYSLTILYMHISQPRWLRMSGHCTKWDTSHQQWVKPFFISAQFATWNHGTSTFCNWLFSLRNLSTCDCFQSGEIHRNNLKCKACERRGIGKCVNYIYMTIFDSIHVTGIYS